MGLEPWLIPPAIQIWERGNPNRTSAKLDDVRDFCRRYNKSTERALLRGLIAIPAMLALCVATGLLSDWVIKSLQRERHNGNATPARAHAAGVCEPESAADRDG